MASRFLDWFRNSNYTATNETFDIGRTTLQSLAKYEMKLDDASNCSENNEYSNGNYNGYEESLMVMSRSYEEICNWIAWKKEKDDLTRQRVIAFVRYYTVSQEQWIFAGIYDVIKKSNFNEIQDGVGYNLVPISEYQNLYGRLVVSYKNTTQQLKRNAENVFNSDGVPKCSYGGIIKPDVVLYEEGLDDTILMNSINVISNADMLIVAGTSLTVQPASGLINYFKGKNLILINRDTTPYDNRANLVINDSLGTVFTQI